MRVSCKAVTALDLSAKLRTASPIVVGGFEVEDPDRDDLAALDGELERQASRVLSPVVDPAADVRRIAPSLLEALRVVESWDELEEATWHEPSHPRWPAGTPGGLGGQFMEVGQRIEFKGVLYDIAGVFPGHIYAHVATHGIKSPSKTIEISGADVKQITRPPAESIKGAKGDTLHMTATVIDPYVDSSTHDPSIAIPAESKITPEEWKRFGKFDQERYVQVMQMHGKWSAGAAQTKLDKIKAENKTEAQTLVSSYASQFGSSTGFTVSLHGMWKGVLSLVKGSPQLESTRASYEKTRAVQNDMASVMQWDIYNRSHSPDIAIFHKTHDLSLFQNEVIKGNKPVFAGLSQSQKWRKQFFGNNTFATPLAVRHVVMATMSANVSDPGYYKDEQEIATADPFNADERSFTFPVPPGMVTKYLEKFYSGGPKPGNTLDAVRDGLKNGGVNLPVPPAEAEIQMDGAGGKEWQTPPVEATQFAYVGGKKTAVTDLPYAAVNPDGTPVTKQMKEMVEAGEIQAGDYIEGMKGTRYVVVPDASDPYLGLAYYKVTNEGKATGPKYTFAATSQESSAFSDHALWTGTTEVYGFEGGGTKAWKKLAGHFEFPSKSKETTGFYPFAWSVGGPDETKFLKDYTVGQKFSVNGVPYEVTGDLAGMKKKIRNLENGKTGQINGDFKTPYLVLKKGYTETGTAQLSMDDFLTGATTKVGDVEPKKGDVFVVGQTLWQAQDDYHAPGQLTAAVVGMVHTPAEHELKQFGKTHVFADGQTVTLLTPKPMGWQPPQKGDTFAYQGAKATVTKILKDGSVQAKTKTGSVKLAPDAPELAFAHRPSAWQLGDTVKLKNMGVGEKFHGGTGKQQIRPYQVVAVQGKNVEVRNLDTGEVVSMSGNKSYARLVVKQTAAAPKLSVDPITPSAPPADVFDPDAWQAAGTKQIADLEVGDKLLTKDGIPFEVLETSGYKGNAEWGSVKNLQTGEVGGYHKQFFAPSPGGAGIVTLLEPKPTDWGAKIAELAPELTAGPYKAGDEGINPSLLQVGDVFNVKNGYDFTVTGIKPDPASTSGGVLLDLTYTNKQGDFKVIDSVGYGNETIQSWSMVKPAQAPTPQSDAAVPAVKKGDLWKSPSSVVYEITSVKSDGKQVYGKQVLGGGKYGAVSELNLQPGGQVVPSAPPTPTVGIGGFQKDNYIWQPVDAATLGDLKPGDVFEGQTGKHFQIKSVSGANVYATNLENGKATKLAGKIKPKLLGAPKNEKLIPYEELKPGDAVLVKNLKKGDMFTSGGTLYEVDVPATGDEENAIVAVVNPGGSLGSKTKFGGSPLSVVSFHVHAGQGGVPSVQGYYGDALKLPNANGYKGDKFDVPMADLVPLGKVPAGELVADGDGQVWKVKAQTGGTTVLSDGEELYKIANVALGKHVSEAEAEALTGKHGDDTPDLDASTPKAVAFGKNLKVGDTVTSNGKTYTVAPGGIAYGDEAGDLIGIADDKVYKLAGPSAPASGPTAAELVGEPEVGPSLPSATETGWDAPIAGFMANTLPLSGLATGTEFMDPEHPGVVFTVQAKSGKSVNAAVVVVLPSATGHDKQLVTGDVIGLNALTHTPDWIAPAGTTDAAHSPAPADLPLPLGSSEDSANYTWGKMTPLSSIPAGTFVKTASDNVFWVSVKNEDGSGTLVSVGNPDVVVDKTAGITMLTPGQPSHEHGSAAVETAPLDKSQYEIVGEKTLGTLQPGDLYISKAATAWETNPNLYKMIKKNGMSVTSQQVAPDLGMTSSFDLLDPDKPAAVFAPKGTGKVVGQPVLPTQLEVGDKIEMGSGGVHTITSIGPLETPTLNNGSPGQHLGIEGPNGEHYSQDWQDAELADASPGNDWTYVGNASDLVTLTPALQVGDPVQPSQLKPGDHMTTSTGGEFEVVSTEPAFQTTGSAPHSNMKLKNVETGVTGAGFYTDTPGSPPWTYAGTGPEPPSAEQIASANTPVGGVKHLVEPDVTEAKKAGEYQSGDTIQSLSYPGGVFRVLEPNVKPNAYAYYTVTKAAVVKPGTSGAGKTGDLVSIMGSTKFVPYKGGPMWKPGEFARVVKPGNKSGQSHIVVGYAAGGQIEVMDAKGKHKSVDPTWLQAISPQYGTTKKLYEGAFPERPAAQLKVGDVFMGGGSNSAQIVDAILPSGEVQTHSWGRDPASAASYSPYTKTIPPTAKVRVLLSARANVAAASLAAADPPPVPGPPPVKKPKPPATATPVLKLGDLPVGTVVEHPGDHSQQFVVTNNAGGHVYMKSATYPDEPDLPYSKSLPMAVVQAAPPPLPTSTSMDAYYPAGTKMSSADAPPGTLLKSYQEDAILRIDGKTSSGHAMWTVVAGVGVGNSDVSSGVGPKLYVMKPKPTAGIGAPAKPDAPAWKPNEDSLTVAALFPGDRFVWKTYPFQVTKKDGGTVYVAALNETTGEPSLGEQGVSFGDPSYVPDKVWFSPAYAMKGPSGSVLEPDSQHALAELVPGDVFSFGEKGAFQYQVFGKGNFSMSYVSKQSSAYSTTTMGDANASEVWFSHHEEPQHAVFTDNDKSITDLPEGTRFVWDGTVFEVLPQDAQSEETAGTWAKPLVADAAPTTFGPEFHPALVQLPLYGDPSKPNWADPGDAPVWQEPDSADITEDVVGVVKPLSSVGVGGWFKVVGGSDATLQGIPDAGKHTWQKTGEMHEGIGFYAVAEDGTKEWFGDSLAVQVADHPVQEKIKQGIAAIVGDAGAAAITQPGSSMPAPKLDKTPGDPVDAFQDLAVGDYVSTMFGSTLRLDKIDELNDIAGGTFDKTFHWTVVTVGGASTLVPGEQTSSPVNTALTPEGWTWAAKPEGAIVNQAAAAAGTGGPLGDVLTPYLWPKSGKKKFPTIGTLTPGTKFQDKTHKTFTVKGKGAGGYVHYTDEGGQEYAAPSGHRVFVLGGS